ncbi:hypothetical protein [Synechococcus sp. NOUM97013]|uniref:hypothetical protein n=1 Tax=Synechococcus sp. NOUM97013 TaxID=1442555 RepID=UPI0018622743|nr:hypothetical protein [Synechococcus sp. NOUM97013]QNI74780.1 hypothetical protein SynNOUM97013_02743 [Synechococcus sp. NOUM97013]
MVLADLRDRFPALDGWMVQLQGLLEPSHVVLAPEDDSLHLALSSQGERQIASLALPPDLCRMGQPLDRQALGETIADLLLERGQIPARVSVELLLPLPSCQWRVVQVAEPGQAWDLDALRALQPDLGWSLTLQESYLDLLPLAHDDRTLVMGTDRLLLQSWIETLAAADLSVRRAEWLLSAAFRGLSSAWGDREERLVWLVEHAGRWRLLLLDGGCPDVDLALEAVELPELRREVLELVQAWRQPQERMGWWVSASPQWQGQWAPEHDPQLGVLHSDAEMTLLDLALIAPREVVV